MTNSKTFCGEVYHGSGLHRKVGWGSALPRNASRLKGCDPQIEDVAIDEPTSRVSRGLRINTNKANLERLLPRSMKVGED